MQNTQFAAEAVQFYAQDGYPLHGTLYRPHHIKASLLLCCATGVPQGFYRRFAEYATLRGYQVLTFDYRGVAKSAPPQLKGFAMSYLDWGRLDVSAAIEYLAQDTYPILMIGHSYGGQALGLTYNHDKVQAMVSFGTGAGWSGYMPLKARLKVQVLWQIIFPPVVRYSGYLPWSKFNMGADLPLGVYQQWRKWCKNPLYFFQDAEQAELIAQFAQVKTPIYAVSALDDDWALPKSRYAFMQHYKNAPIEYINLRAQDVGMQKIGHMGYFRQGAEQIWQRLFDRLDKSVGQ